MKSAAIACLLALLTVLPQDASKPAAKLPEVGKPAPVFRLNDQAGRAVSVGGKSETWTAVCFYPKAFTSGCTKEVCSLRDGQPDWSALGLEVYGVSLDGVEDQKGFAEKYELPFALLSDPDGSAATKYGVLDPKGTYTQRLTFLIDEQGVLRKVLEQVDVEHHGKELAELVKKLRGA